MIATDVVHIGLLPFRLYQWPSTGCKNLEQNDRDHHLHPFRIFQNRAGQQKSCVVRVKGFFLSRLALLRSPDKGRIHSCRHLDLRHLCVRQKPRARPVNKCRQITPPEGCAISNRPPGAILTWLPVDIVAKTIEITRYEKPLDRSIGSIRIGLDCRVQ